MQSGAVLGAREQRSCHTGYQYLVSDGSSQQMFRQKKRMEKCMGSFSQVYPCDFWQSRAVVIRDFLN